MGSSVAATARRNAPAMLALLATAAAGTPLSVVAKTTAPGAHVFSSSTMPTEGVDDDDRERVGVGERVGEAEGQGLAAADAEVCAVRVGGGEGTGIEASEDADVEPVAEGHAVREVEGGNTPDAEASAEGVPPSRDSDGERDSLPVGAPLRDAPPLRLAESDARGEFVVAGDVLGVGDARAERVADAELVAREEGAPLPEGAPAVADGGGVTEGEGPGALLAVPPEGEGLLTEEGTMDADSARVSSGVVVREPVASPVGVSSGEWRAPALAAGGSDGDGASLGDAPSEGEGSPLGEALPRGDAEALGAPLAVLVGRKPVAVGEGAPVTEGGGGAVSETRGELECEAAAEAERDAAEDADAREVCDGMERVGAAVAPTEPLPPPLGEARAEEAPDGEPSAVALAPAGVAVVKGDGEAGAEGEVPPCSDLDGGGEDVGEPDADALALIDGEGEPPPAEGDGAADGDGAPEGVGSAETPPEALEQPDGGALASALPEAPKDALGALDALTKAEVVGVSVAARDCDSPAEGVVVAEDMLLGEACALTVRTPVALVSELPLPEEEPLAEGAPADGVRKLLLLAPADLDALELPLPLPAPLEDAVPARGEAVPVALPCGDPVRPGERVAPTDVAALPEGDGEAPLVIEALEEPLADGAAEAEASADALAPPRDADAWPLADGVAPTVPLSPPEAVGAPEALAPTLPEPHALPLPLALLVGDGVPRALRDAVGEALPNGEALPPRSESEGQDEGDAAALAVPPRPGDTLPVGDSEGLDEGGAEGLPAAEREGEGSAVGVPEADGEGVARWDADADGLEEAERSTEALASVERLRARDGVLSALPVAPAGEALSPVVAVPLRSADDEGEGAEEGVPVPTGVHEGSGDALCDGEPPAVRESEEKKEGDAQALREAPPESDAPRERVSATVPDCATVSVGAAVDVVDTTLVGDGAPPDRVGSGEAEDEREARSVGDVDGDAEASKVEGDGEGVGGAVPEPAPSAALALRGAVREALLLGHPLGLAAGDALRAPLEVPGGVAVAAIESEAAGLREEDGEPEGVRVAALLRESAPECEPPPLGDGDEDADGAEVAEARAGVLDGAREVETAPEGVTRGDPELAVLPVPPSPVRDPLAVAPQEPLIAKPVAVPAGSEGEGGGERERAGEVEALGHPVGDCEGRGDAVPPLPGEWEATPETLLAGDAVALPPLGAVEGVPPALLLWVGERDAPHDGVRGSLLDMSALRDAPPPCEKEPRADAEGASGEPVGGAEGRVDTVKDARALREGDANPEGEPLPDGKGVPRGVPDGEFDARGVRERVLVGECDGEGKGDALALTPVEAVPLVLSEGVGVRVRNVEPVEEGDGRSEREGDALAGAVGSGKRLREACGENEKDCVTVGEMVPPPPLAVGARPEAEGEPDGSLGEGLGEPPLGVGVATSVGGADGECAAEALAGAVPVGEGDPAAPEALAAGERLAPLCSEGVACADSVSAALPLAEAETARGDPEGDPPCEALTDAEGVPEADATGALPLALAHALGESVPEGSGDAVSTAPLPVAEVDGLDEATSVLEPESVLAGPVPLADSVSSGGAVAAPVEDSVLEDNKLPVPVGATDPEADAEGEGVPVSVAAAAVADGEGAPEGENVPHKLADGNSVRTPLSLAVALPLAVPLPLAVSERGALGVAHAELDTEALAVPAGVLPTLKDCRNEAVPAAADAEGEPVAPKEALPLRESAGEGVTLGAGGEGVGLLEGSAVARGENEGELESREVAE